MVYLISSIEVFTQTDWLVLPVANTIVWSGCTVIIPEAVAIIQSLPVVVIVKLNGDATVVVGEPCMVNVVPVTDAVIPAGKPVTVALLAPPPNVYIIGFKGALIHTVWTLFAPVNVIVWLGLIVITALVSLLKQPAALTLYILTV